MKTPKPRRLPSGSWNVRLRLGGKSISITEPTEKACVQKAQILKAEHLAGKTVQKIQDTNLTLARAIEIYCADRSNSLSPSTVRKYYNIKKNQFPDLMNQRLDRITDRQWQRSVNEMLASYAPKSVKVSVGMVKTVVAANAVKFPPVTVGGRSRQKAAEADKCKFLEPDEILLFVKAAAKSAYAVPLLLALSSLRIAEIDGLDWKDVTKDTVKVRRVRIKDKDENWILKEGAKTEGSVRDVPIFIPELQAALERERKPDGKLMTCSQEAIRRNCGKICKSAGIPNPGIHGLRHSFASLCASDRVRIPQHISQEIGGWENDKVMKEIYTHVAKSDRSACISRLREFYENKPKSPEQKTKNANENANKAPDI